jgi:MerR family transcriptional regulator, copper efflux regulator
MLISEFARAAGMSVDTVRFYVRQGLLRPQTGTKGGANPYQIFDARVIRLLQSLGFSLKEIGGVAEEYRRGDMTPERGRTIMAGQLGKLEAKRDGLDAMIAYARAKIAWMDGGNRGPEPQLAGFGACGIDGTQPATSTAP